MSDRRITMLCAIILPLALVVVSSQLTAWVLSLWLAGVACPYVRRLAGVSQYVRAINRSACGRGPPGPRACDVRSTAAVRQGPAVSCAPRVGAHE